MTVHQSDDRFIALDLLRGIAALTVVFWHVAPHCGVGQKDSGAYLAVDFFFQLSGFVLASAYGARLQTGMTTPRFMLIRIVRLYPLYVLTIALGCLTLLLTANVFLGPLALSIALSLLMLPTLFGPVMKGQFLDTAFPVNSPAWSLSLELGVNLLYGLLRPYLDLRVLAAILVLALAPLSLVALHDGHVWGGPTITTYWTGWLRVIFSFFLGVALFQLHTRRPDRRVSLPTLAAGVLLFAALLAPVPPFWRSYADLGTVVLLMPAIIWFAAPAKPRGVLARICTEAGLASYAIYIMQMPLISALARTEQFRGLSGALALCAIVGIVAELFTRLYDMPVRRAINAFLRAHKTQKADA